MKTLLTALAVVALASTAMAVPYGDYGVLALDVRDQGEAFLVNTTDATIEFMGYGITSEAGLLDYMAYVGIGETCMFDPETWGPILGWDAGRMGKCSPTTSALAELTVNSPLTFPAGFAISIGNACPNGTDADIDFYYADGASQDVDGVVFDIPEPATMSLLALGGLAVTRRRRR